MEPTVETLTWKMSVSLFNQSFTGDQLGAMLAAESDAAAGVLHVKVDDERIDVEARAVANCAGLFAPRIAQETGLDAPLLLARGSYFSLKGDAPFSRLVYPLPEPGGLGVHATLDLSGRCRFGPDVEWLPEGTSPDAPGLYEVDAARADPFYEAVRTYYPALADGALATPALLLAGEHDTAAPPAGVARLAARFAHAPAARRCAAHSGASL